MIELPQTTLWVAAVFFHRFYMRFSMVEEKGGVHHYVRDTGHSSDREGEKLLDLFAYFGGGYTG